MAAKSQMIKEELLALHAASDDGLLRPASVVAWAADNPTSALHGALEWDDQKAASEHRLAQVRQLISLHVVSSDGDPVLVSLSIDRHKKGGGYRDLSDVVKDRDLTAILMRDALAELERVKAKYERLQELSPLWEQMEAVRSRITSQESEQRQGAN